MAQGDNLYDIGRQSGVADLVIVGGGIMGLWAALRGCRRGLSVTLVERDTIGAGASGGLLGALMPHTPDRWSPKKQLQFEALLSLEGEIANLEDETGLRAGYRRAGRLIPLPKPHLAAMARGHEHDAAVAWKAGDRQFHWQYREPGYRSGLINPEAMLAGCVEEDFAARVSPRGLTALLDAALARQPGFTLLRDADVTEIDARAGQVRLARGGAIPFGHLILAAGTGTERLLQSLAGPLPRPVVVPVKGQAALLKADLPPETPVIYLDGLYVVPHEGGQVAIGSTSEIRFSEPFSTDGQLDALIAAARNLVPALAEAPVLERWAGLRPKAIGRDPMVGRLPGPGRVSVLTGGFKVSFGLAHRLAEALIDAIVSGRESCDLPESFSPAAHLKDAARAPGG